MSAEQPASGATDPSAADGLAIRAGGRAVRLKWHKLRRDADDPAFHRPNLAAGLAAGASMEVDVQLLSDGEFVCLHDETLDTETDGTGPVAAADSRTIAGLRHRDGAGRATGPAPLTLRELVAILQDNAATAAEGAVVQLDLKESADALTDAAIERFSTLVAPAAALLSLSGEDWPAVSRLGGRVHGLSLGYDPTMRVLDEALTVGDLSGLADHVASAAPEAETVYLHHSLLAAARDRRVDLVGALHRQGRLVDCWTLGTDRPGTEALLRLALESGVDQITTDTPADLQALWAGMTG